MRCRRCRMSRATRRPLRCSPRPISWPRPRSCCRGRRIRSYSPAAARAAWTAGSARVALAEKLNAPVLTSIKLAAAFPTDHRLHPVPPFQALPREAGELIVAADVVLALDWLDLAGTFKQAYGDKPVSAKVIMFHATRTVIAAGARTIRDCRRRICICCAKRMPPCRCCWTLAARARKRRAAARRGCCRRRPMRCRCAASPSRSKPRHAASMSAIRAFRWAGTAPTRISAIRSPTSATTAAPASVRARA